MNYFNQYMNATGLPTSYAPLMHSQPMHLESMFPMVYHIVKPKVKMACDMLHHQSYGNPSPMMIQHAVDMIYDEVEPMVSDEDMDGVESNMNPYMGEASEENEKRQFEFFPGSFHRPPRRRRRFLRDIISILLISELLGRRSF